MNRTELDISLVFPLMNVGGAYNCVRAAVARETGSVVDVLIFTSICFVFLRQYTIISTAVL